MSIRDKIIGQKKNFNEVKFEYKLDNNEILPLIIREPSIAQIDHTNKLRFTKDDKGELTLKDNAHLDITMYYLVNLVRDLDGKQVFEDTDKDIVFNHSANSDTARLIETLWQVIRGDLTPKKPLETQKEV